MNNLNKNNNRNPKSTRSTFMIAMSVLVALSLWMFFSSMLLQPNGDEIEYTQFLTRMKEEGVSAVKYSRQDGKIYGLDANTTRDPDDLPGRYDFFVIMPDAEQFRADTQAIIAKQTNVAADLVDATEYGFTFDYQKATDFTLLSFIPYLFLIGSVFFLFFMMRQQGNGSSFGKSKARVITNEVTKVKFTDVAGADEEKEELAEIVDFLKNPKYFSELGAHVPKGVLLMGPPGTGKTLLAKAVAGEANVPFYSMSGAGFVELFVGVGASRVRDLFATAKKSAPAIIFIDEIDAVGRQRSAGGGGGAQDEREQTLNQLLVEMDGFDPNSGIIVIAATNRSDVLDPALLRPGRFDRRVVVNPPDVKGREEILKIHSRNKKLGSDVNLQVLAQRTPGFTGADLENVLNEAAILAVREGKSQINMSEVEEAITRGLVGLEKKNRVISESDKRLTAYHEVGHALVARELPNCDSVHEISIIPRGQAGGYTLTLPDQDTAYTTKQQLLDSIAMLLGGRVSESVYLGEISTGASSDLQRATETARQMVTRFGMSSKIGPIFLGNEPDMMTGMVFGFSQGPLYSEAVASKIDEEIRMIIEDAYERADKILTEHRETVEAVVNVLMQKERIRGDEFEEICLNVHDYAPAKDTTLKNDTDPAIDQIIE